jgi:hypothetical protein
MVFVALFIASMISYGKGHGIIGTALLLVSIIAVM